MALVSIALFLGSMIGMIAMMGTTIDGVRAWVKRCKLEKHSRDEKKFSLSLSSFFPFLSSFSRQELRGKHISSHGY